MRKDLKVIGVVIGAGLFMVWKLASFFLLYFSWYRYSEQNIPIVMEVIIAGITGAIVTHLYTNRKTLRWSQSSKGVSIGLLVPCVAASILPFPFWLLTLFPLGTLTIFDLGMVGTPYALQEVISRAGAGLGSTMLLYAFIGLVIGRLSEEHH